MSRASILAVAFASVSLFGAPHAVLGGAEDWNDANVRWVSYEKGLEEAKNTGKPVCLIFYTTWCPHCANYAKVFADPRVVEKSKQFVMVRVDADKERGLSEKYKPDGAYIPRTFFLSPDGRLDETITAGRPQYKYFYDELNPAGILTGMDAALAKLSRR